MYLQEKKSQLTKLTKPKPPNKYETMCFLVTKMSPKLD